MGFAARVLFRWELELTQVGAGTDAGGTAVRSSRDYGRDPANRGACIMTLLPRGVKVHLAFGFTRRWFTAPFR